MPHRIPFQSLPYDENLFLRARLQTASVDHGEAILSACQVLQGLQDQGVLDILRGLLDSRDELMETTIDAAKSPQTLRGIRNLMILANLLGALEPQQLKNITQAVPLALDQLTRKSKPLGFWKSVWMLLAKSRWRRPLAAIAVLLRALDPAPVREQ